MTTAADITIKKNDGTTDIVYTLIAASGGDKSPALWRSNSETGTPGQKPYFSVSCQPNGTNTGRRVSIVYTRPQVYTDANTSLTQVSSKASAKIDIFIPLDMTSTNALEFGAQLGNLMASAMAKSASQSGFAPT